MSWMKYNKETGQIDLLPYISELSDFQAIVMDEHTWNIMIIPVLFEPPVRTLRATVPEKRSHIFR